jgi:hypothetical protein
VLFTQGVQFLRTVEFPLLQSHVLVIEGKYRLPQPLVLQPFLLDQPPTTILLLLHFHPQRVQRLLTLQLLTEQRSTHLRHLVLPLQQLLLQKSYLHQPLLLLPLQRFAQLVQFYYPIF